MNLEIALLFYGAFAVSLMYGLGMYSLLPAGRFARHTLGGLATILVAIAVYLGPDHSLFKLGIASGIAPIICFVIYAVLVNAFIKKFGRAPTDVTFNWGEGLIWDRGFAFTVTGGFILPLAFLLNNLRP